MYSTTEFKETSNSGDSGGILGTVPRVSEGSAQNPPPTGNTGVVTALVDYIAVTFQKLTVEEVAARFGSVGWTPLPNGRNGYKTGRVSGHIRIYSDGADGMGVHAVVSGQGCRQMEGAGVTSWPKWFAEAIAVGASFTRVDVALDEREGLLDLEKLRSMVESAQVVSRYKGARPDWGYSLSTGECTGRTLYFGSKKSDTQMRIYDKRLEQHLPADAAPWVRCELQARDERADKLAAVLAGSDTLAVVAGVVGGLVDFKDRGAAKQRERWETCAAWASFLEGVSKIRLSVSPVVKTVEDAYKWLCKQAASSLAMVLEAAGGDMEPIWAMIASGKSRYTAKHRSMLALVSGLSCAQQGA